MQETFTDIYETNFWKDKESVSGHGSRLDQTKHIRKEIPKLLDLLLIESVLDIPCGDLNWWSQMKISEDIKYIGADIVPELIKMNRERYPEKTFYILDITSDPLPKADMLIVRDLFGHLSYKDIKLALKNIRESGATYLLATTFPGRENVQDITTGEWRPVNMASFFGLPDPIMVINEHATGGFGEFKDKSLGLWKLEEEE